MRSVRVLLDYNGGAPSWRQTVKTMVLLGASFGQHWWTTYMAQRVMRVAPRLCIRIFKLSMGHVNWSGISFVSVDYDTNSMTDSIFNHKNKTPWILGCIYIPIQDCLPRNSSEVTILNFQINRNWWEFNLQRCWPSCSKQGFFILIEKKISIIFTKEIKRRKKWYCSITCYIQSFFWTL